jgi:signal transduction histidine kinase
VWVVTPDGFTIFQLNKQKTPTAPPPIHLTRFQVNEHLLDFSRPLELSFHQNNCRIEFIGISYRDQKALRYQYRLEGADKDWTLPTDQHAVTFAALKPGSYTFQVRAINAAGVASPRPASLSFAIVPPFWQRWWFLTSLSVLCVGMVAFLFRRRLETLRKEKQTQEEFSRRLIASQEQERKRIAAELHDSLGQNLLLIKNNALHALDGSTDRERMVEQLENISSLASQSVGEVRQISHNLSPYLLDKLGLTKALKAIFRRTADASGIRFKVDIDEVDGIYSSDEEINIYRIVQESANNIMKHSRASDGSVSLKRDGSSVRIIISDNGRGFAVDPTTTDQHGFGLKGIQERVRILKGTFSLTVSPGKGTAITVELPLPRGCNGR